MAIQTQAPTKPVITSVGHAGSGAIADSNPPVITGTGDPGNMIMLYDGIRLVGTVTAGVDGSWSHGHSRRGQHSRQAAIALPR